MQADPLYKFLRCICRVATTDFFDLVTYGTRHVPPTGGVLLAANHQSYLDPVLVAVQLRRPVSYFAKSGLFKGGWSEWLIRRLHGFPVRQGEGDVRAIKEAIQRLQEGHALGVFPEGSRTPDEQLGRLEPGIALMVRRAGVPVVPVAIDGAFQAWPIFKKRPRRYPLRVMYGEPMDLSRMKGERIVQALDQRLRRMMAELRARPHPAAERRGILPPPTRLPPPAPGEAARPEGEERPAEGAGAAERVPGPAQGGRS